ncbi:hypothetical protein EP47_09360 [Legionella norrlandica]|uniref:Ankyrin n=1 Tax=Legionella norrlandica TaxID=1498499 RepID=A0A0A2T7D0_9GAMM|nr:ankyrin repeat domain-containing protein [Legionella norrlandica]KGP63328.1 hypothetical protein EP47_09360 [Legionella norrlandica]
MKKNELMVLLDKYLIDKSEEEKQYTYIKGILIKKHGEKIYDIFNSLVNSENNEEINFEIFKNIFLTIWEEIKCTALSYTALPESATTKFLVSLACALFSEKGKTSLSLIEVIQLLMPSLIFGESPEIHTPKDWRWQSGSASKISTLSFQENCNRTTVVIKFLKTHIISDNGQYIIPLWALNSLGTEEINMLVHNYYFENDPNLPSSISDSEFKRLSTHNSLTKNLIIHYESMQNIAQDKTTLLGQLHLLYNSLFYNSKDGIGTEEIAGSGVEKAIRNFFEYYNKLQKSSPFTLDDKLTESLNKLRNCIGEYLPGERPIGPLETCMLLRKNSLHQAMLGKEVQLAGIGLRETDSKEFIEKLKIEFSTTLDKLNESIETGMIEGYDHLPLTKKLFESCNIKFTGYSFQSLVNLIKDLPEIEIEKILLGNEVHIKNWGKTIKKLENLIILFTELTPTKIETLCKHLLEYLKEYLNKAEYLYFLLTMTNEEMQKVIFKHLINKENLLINEGVEKGLLDLLLPISLLFELTWNQFSEEEKLLILGNKNNPRGNTILHSSVTYPGTLQIVLKYLTPNRMKGNSYFTLNKNLDNLIHLAAPYPESLEMIFNWLPEEEHLNAIKSINIVKNTPLHIAIKNLDSLKIILKRIPLHELKDILFLSNACNETPFGLACENNNLKIILKLFLENDRLDLLKQYNKKTGNIFLEDYAFCNSNKIPLFLNLLPKNQRLDLIKTPFEDGNTFFHIYAHNPAAINYLFEEFPVTQAFTLFTRVIQRTRDTVFHKAVNNPAALKILFDKITCEEYLKILNLSNRYSHSFVEYALKRNFDSFIYIWQRTPKEHMSELIKNIQQDFFEILFQNDQLDQKNTCQKLGEFLISEKIVLPQFIEVLNHQESSKFFELKKAINKQFGDPCDVLYNFTLNRR